MKYPLLYIGICFAIGIIIHSLCNLDSFNLPKAYSLYLATCVGILCYLFRNSTRKKQWLLITFAFIVLGFWRLELQQTKYQALHYENYRTDGHQQMTIEIIDQLKNNKKNYRFFAKVTSLNGHPSTGKILVQQPKSENPFQIGNEISTISNLQPIQGANLPYQFDYRKYLARHEVFRSVTLQPAKYRIIQHHSNTRFFIANFKNEMMKQWSLNNIKPNEIHFLKALLLGDRVDLEPELIQAYSRTGVIHILSISGLHFGILIVSLRRILAPFKHVRHHRYWSVLIILFFLWTYAYVAGMSPPIVRCMTMFSFITIGLFLRRNTDLLHSLSASFLILLIIQPNYIFDIGFQLSYAAMLAIFYGNKIWQPIRKKIPRLVSLIYDIITVSTSAQIGVLPLSTFYFNQIPLFFLISNLIVMPLVSIIMIVGMCTLILNMIGIPYGWLGNVLSNLIQWMNSYTLWLSNFSFTTIENIPFHLPQLIISTIVICTLYRMLIYKKTINFLAFSTSLIALQLSYVIQINHHEKKRQIWIQHQFNNSSLMAIEGRSVRYYQNSPLTINSWNQAFLTGNFIRNIEEYPLPNLMTIDDITLLRVVPNMEIAGVKTDIVWLTDSPFINIEKLITEIEPKAVIVDGSNYPSLINYWRSYCTKNKIPFLDTTEMGSIEILSIIKML